MNIRNFFKDLLMDSMCTNLHMTVEQDKSGGIATWDGGKTASGIVSRGGTADPRINNFVGNLHLPFKIPAVSPEHDVLVLYGRTSPVGDYAEAPIGSLFLQYTIASTAISGLEIWKKESATLWVPLGSDILLTDPGDAAAIPVTQSGVVPIVTASGETRTMAIPQFPGQKITLCLQTDVGDCGVTVASAFDSNGSTVAILNDAGDNISFEAIYVGAALAWRVYSNNGCLVGDATHKGLLVADPGDAGAIAVTQSGYCPLVTATGETRTLAIPTFAGQILTLAMKTDAGDSVTTVASAIDAIGHTTITHNTAGDTITLIGVYVGSALAWRIMHEDGVLLGSTAGFGNIIADVGHTNAIPVTHKEVGMPITTAGSETNTLAIPTMAGQLLSLWCDTYSSGDRVVTVASGINAANNTTMTFGVESDHIDLKAVTVGGVYAWQVVSNDGVALG